MQRYSFVARWVTCKKNIDGDALSRAPVDSHTIDDQIAKDTSSFTGIRAIINAIEESDYTVSDIRGLRENHSCSSKRT